MKRSEKQNVVDALREQIDLYSHFYVADLEALNAEQTSDLRRLCFSQEVKLIVAKNTLLKRAIDESNKDASELYDLLKGNTSILLSNTGNVPAKLIKEFAAKNGKPELKGAYVEECCYVGANQLGALIDVKSREELIGEVITLLQSPAKNVISALKSGGSTIAGVVKTLQERTA